MSIFKNIAGMLRASVGNNLDNNPKDVENTKKHYAAIGRYKRPVENGYILIKNWIMPFMGFKRITI